MWSASSKLADYDLKANTTLNIPLSGVAVANGAPLILGFYLPDAKSPKELGVNDLDVPLGVFVTGVQLMP